MIGLFKRPSPVARRIADEFRHGRIVHRDLNGHGISEMAVNYRGAVVRLSWYEGLPGRGSRSFSINGSASFPKGADSKHIFKAAWKRADRLTEEHLKWLAQKWEEAA